MWHAFDLKLRENCTVKFIVAQLDAKVVALKERVIEHSSIFGRCLVDTWNRTITHSRTNLMEEHGPGY
jgi:hypothetical protein